MKNTGAGSPRWSPSTNRTSNRWPNPACHTGRLGIRSRPAPSHASPLLQIHFRHDAYATRGGTTRTIELLKTLPTGCDPARISAAHRVVFVAADSQKQDL